MIITRDHKLIMPIIDEVLDTFNDGEDLPDGFIDRDDKLFMFENGCLFVATIRPDIMLANIHAAVPKKYRGRRALKAVQVCVKWLKDHGYNVISSVKHQSKSVRSVINAAGARYIQDYQQYRIYRW